MGMNTNFLDMFEKHLPEGHGAALGHPDVVRGKKRIESYTYFKSKNLTFDTFDVVKIRGDEIIVDLNHPLDVQQRYDFLINPGTYEHCFNIGQAVVNGYKLVRPGGLSFHTGPIARGKHGFWNFNKDTLDEFYLANGGEIIDSFRVEGSIFLVAKNGPDGPIKLPYEVRK